MLMKFKASDHPRRSPIQAAATPIPGYAMRSASNRFTLLIISSIVCRYAMQTVPSKIALLLNTL